MRIALCWIYIKRHSAHVKCPRHLHGSPGLMSQTWKETVKTMLGCVAHLATFRIKDAFHTNITRTYTAACYGSTRGFLGKEMIIFAGQPTSTLYIIIIKNRSHNFEGRNLEITIKQKCDSSTKMSENREEVPNDDDAARSLVVSNDNIPFVDLAGSTTSCDDTDTPEIEYDGLPVTMSFRSALDNTTEEEEVTDLEEDEEVGETVEDDLPAETPGVREDGPVYAPSIYAAGGGGDEDDGDVKLLEDLQNTIRRNRGGALNAQRDRLKKSPKTSPRKNLRTSPRLTPKSSPLKNSLKSPKRSPMKSPMKSPKTSPKIRLMKSQSQSPANSPRKNHRNDPRDTHPLPPDDLRHLIEREKERTSRGQPPEVGSPIPETEPQERSVRKKLFKEEEPNTPNEMITIDQLRQGLNLATHPHPHPGPSPSAGPEPWRETPTETRTRRAYVKNIRKARSLRAAEQKTNQLEESKPVLNTDSTDTVEPKLEDFIKVKDMESLLKKEPDIKSTDDGFSQSEENALGIIGITSPPRTTAPEGLCGCLSLCRGTDGYGRCLSLPSLDPPIEAPTFVMVGLPNTGEPFTVAPEQIHPSTVQSYHDADDTHPPLTQSIMSTNRGVPKDHYKAFNECHRAVSTGHHLPDFFNQGANIDTLISETIDELSQWRATREVLESEDMGQEVGAASLLGTQRELTEQIVRLVDRLRILNYDRRNLIVEIQAQQEILDEFVSEGINTTASPSVGLSQDDNGLSATQNATRKATQKANCANQIRWDRFAGFLPNPRTFWRGLEYNYVYNDDDNDWLYDEEDEQEHEQEQDHDMDVDGNEGTSPTRSANVSWYCACERGRCTCDDKSREESNPNYNLNDTD